MQLIGYACIRSELETRKEDVREKFFLFLSNETKYGLGTLQVNKTLELEFVKKLSELFLAIWLQNMEIRINAAIGYFH